MVATRVYAAAGFSHSHSLFVNVLVCIELSLDSIGSSGYKEISFIKIDQGGPEIGQIHPNDPRRVFFWLNLSKKVKFHLFCINLDTGYLLYFGFLKLLVY